MTINKYQWIVIAVIIAFIILLLNIHFPVSASQEEKVNVCHKTHSQTNPWVAQRIKANELQSHLDNGDFLYNGPVGNNGQPTDDSWCDEHAPLPSVTPTVTPTPTDKKYCNKPTPTVTLTPTIHICDGDCEEITPTPTQEASPSSVPQPTRIPGNTTNTGNQGGEAPKGGNPECTLSVDTPLLQGFKRISPTQVKLSWWAPVDGAEKYSLIYGYSQDQMNFGIDNIDGSLTTYTVNDLQPNRMVFFQLWSWHGVCAGRSTVIDP